MPSDSCLPLPLFLCQSLPLLCLVSFLPVSESNRRGANWIEACQCAQRAPTMDKTNLGLLVAIRGHRRGRQTPIESSYKAIQLATAVANAAYSHTIIAVVAQKTFQWVSCLPQKRSQVNSSLELARTWELQLSLRQVLDGPGGTTMANRIESGQTKQHLQQLNCLPQLWIESLSSFISLYTCAKCHKNFPQLAAIVKPKPKIPLYDCRILFLFLIFMFLNKIK